MIRPLLPGDLDAVLAIWLEANCQAHPFIPSAYWHARREEVGQALPQAEVYVYEETGIIQGFTGLTGNYLAGLFVRPGEQSRGIGKQLLDQAKSVRDRLELHVYENNTRAAAFYRREGFFLLEASSDPDTGQAEAHMGWIRPEGESKPC